MNIWIEGARPKTWIASLSPVLIGGAIAFERQSFSIVVFFASLLFALALQIGTNFANDYLDFLKGTDTSERKGPRRLVQSGLISVKQMRKAAFGFFFIAGTLGLYLMSVGGALIGGLALLAIALGFLYTGGPYPLGYLGLGDILVLIFFGPVATGAVGYLLTGSFSSLAALAGISPGLLSMALLSLNNLRDYATDKISQKKSLPVRFGLRFGQWECALSILIAPLNPLFLFWVSNGTHPWSLTAIGTLGLGLPLIRTIFIDPTPSTLASLFPKLGRLFFLYTLLFSIGWLL